MKGLIEYILFISIVLSPFQVSLAQDVKSNHQTIIRSHTQQLSAYAVPYSQVPLIRRIISNPSRFDITFSNSDLEQLNSYQRGVRGLEVLRAYKPLFEEALAASDVSRLGTLLSESREAEQMVYQRELTSLIDSLSPSSQRKVKTALDQLLEELRFNVTDWRAVALDEPEIVIEMANQFVRRVDLINPARDASGVAVQLVPEEK